MAKKVFNLATEEWVLELLAKLQVAKYDELKTEDKTIIGALNEIMEMVKLCLHPTYDVKVQMFYGILDPDVVGPITDYFDINVDMLDNSDLVSTKPGTRPSIKIQDIKEGQYIIVAIPAMYSCEVTKDDGFGNKVMFDEDIVGANGIDIEINGQDYRVYGELVLVEGDRTIYIDVVTDDGCDCPDITIQDIDDIIGGLDD